MKGSEIGLLSMISSLVLAGGTAMQWIDRVGSGAEGQFIAPVVRTWNWWQIGGMNFTIGQSIDGLAVIILCCRRLYLNTGAVVFDRILEGRSSLHALLCCSYVVLGGHARHGDC